MNLPPTSVRDIVVHENDLVVGTHGRGFWILDDITAMRQMSAAVASSDAFLFKPGNAYRVQRNINTDTPLPPEEPAGQNPPDGAIVDYVLKADGPVTLEVLDSAGKLVRKYASTDLLETVDERELNVPMYWVRQSRVLSGKAGMHRWVWDLRYAPPPGARQEYPISAIVHDTPAEPLGYWAMPGTYSVRLTAAGVTMTQTFVVKMDPRLKTPVAALAKQFELSSKVTDMYRQTFEASEEVKTFRAGLKGNPELDRKAAAILGSGGSGRRGGGGGEGESLTKLSGELLGALAVLDGADAAPTATITAAVADYLKTGTAQLAAWHELRKNAAN